MGCIIQARMGSTRLPGKVLKLVDNTNSSLYYTINQLKNCKGIDKIIVATTTKEEDDVIVEYLQKLSIEHFRGNPTDVLDRYYACAKKFSVDSVIRITADCPLIDPEIVDRGISIFKSGQYDYVTNTFPRTFPDGNETEIFSFNALEIAWKNAILPSEREHVTPYFRNQKEKFKINNFEHTQDLSHLRWTMDLQEDLNLIRSIILKLDKHPIHLADILELFNKNPELVKINKGHIPNEGYMKSLKEDEEFLKSKNSSFFNP